MEASRLSIPYYDDINEFIASIPMDYKTNNSSFYCLRLKPDDTNSYKPPFRRGFYFVGLLTNAEKTKITYDTTTVDNLDSVLVFQSPGLVYSFYRSSSTHGYLIYFKPECISYFKPRLDSEFSFFDTQHTDLFKINQSKFKELSPQFEEVFQAYETASDKQQRIASLKLLALLYQLKNVADFNQWKQRLATPQQLLLKKFIALVNTHYIEKRHVEDYAELLCVSANHLSQSVKSVSGRNALSHINERVVNEAKSLIHYTNFDIAEIGYQLNFSDPANFGKFFKKQTGITPLDFRRSNTIATKI